MRRASAILLVVLLLAAASGLPARAAETGAVAGQSYYTHERLGRLILLGEADSLAAAGAVAQVLMGGEVLVAGVFPDLGRRATVPFPLVSLPQGESRITCRLLLGGEEVGRETATVTRLPHRPNAVKIDRIGGGLIVDDLPLFPFGFYCYSPVQPVLAREEVVRGFNLMSPYQANDPETLAERRAYMDQCAAVGMKVHYQLLRVAGGGGVGGATADEAGELEELLRAEVEAFRDHPALLAWYLSDEPTGHNTPPEALQRAYDVVRDLDPYHPITIVFMAPGRAAEYASVMDVVMTDPYPIPNSPPGSVAGAVRVIADAFEPIKPVWLVPQAFGGNEWWTREPTAAEQRVMTYLGLVEGATGVQYFIRHGPSRFPKSPNMWSACSRMALEVASLTPHLLSHERRPLAIPESESIRAAAWRHRGQVLVIAVNTENLPQDLSLVLDGVDLSSAGEGPQVTEPQADVLFEDRSVPVKTVTARGEGFFSSLLSPADRLTRAVLGAPGRGDSPRVVIEDVIDRYGVRIYRLLEGSASVEVVSQNPRNQILDPSFEWEPEPSIPAAMYAGREGGRGATYFLDPRLALHGRRSVRLHSPGPGQGVPLHPYSPLVTEERSYRLSVWARASQASFAAAARAREAAAAAWRDSLGGEVAPDSLLPPAEPSLSLRIGEDAVLHPLTTDWQEYHLDSMAPPEAARLGVSLALATAGTAWLDLLQFYDISPRIEARAGDDGSFSVSLHNYLEDSELRYTLDGSEPTPSSPLYTHPFQVDATTEVQCVVYRGGQVRSRSQVTLHRHDALGSLADLLHPLSSRYPAGGPGALTDGLLATPQYRDDRWQGFEQVDVDALLDLGRVVPIRRVAARFLQNYPVWIWLPTRVSFYGSVDGDEFELLGHVDGDVAQNEPGAIVHTFELGSMPASARYLRMHAQNVGECPPWHGGAGGPAWIFVDEILVNGDR